MGATGDAAENACQGIADGLTPAAENVPVVIGRIELGLGKNDVLAEYLGAELPEVAPQPQGQVGPADVPGSAEGGAGEAVVRGTAFAIGPDDYGWFLANVALIPHTPGELLAQGRQEWSRVVAWDLVEQNRNRQQAELPLFKTLDQQIRASDLREREIRAFLESHDLMTVPDWLQHYRARPMTPWLEPLAFLGVNDDLTSETRLDEDAYRYIPEPGPDLPYFQLSAARDPRPLIIHEGVPGHYFQLALSWSHPDPIRRRYIDSSANEGIALYVEELLLQAGLFDFSPQSREMIYNFMRLRALRVEVDIRLAVGDFTIEQAADYLARSVPMDRATAREEAVFFASTPGQAISYQIGKLQIIRFLADAKLARGDDFSLRKFHDYLMRNGNVPIALQRWEYLGDETAVQRLEALGGDPVADRQGLVGVLAKEAVLLDVEINPPGAGYVADARHPLQEKRLVDVTDHVKDVHMGVVGELHSVNSR